MPGSNDGWSDDEATAGWGGDAIASTGFQANQSAGGFSVGFGNKRNDNTGFRGGFGGGRGGFQSNRFNDDSGENGSGGSFSRGRGGYQGRGRRDSDGDSGSRGGFRHQNDDENGFNNRGGGFRGPRNDHDSGIQSKQFKFGRNDADEGTGGFTGRGFGGQSKFSSNRRGSDDENGGGYSRGFSSFRNDNDGESGFKSNSRGGGGRGGRGFGGFRNDDDQEQGNARGGGRGGGRGFGGFRNNDGDQDGGNSRGGGRGGGRGGFGSGDGVKRENYVPEDISEEDIHNSGISSGINFSKYDKIDVKVTGSNAPEKIHSFMESGLRPILIDNIKKSSYSTPTPIQKAAIPIIMGKRDLMACAQTGSGKTAAFLLPIMHSLLENLEHPEVSPSGEAQPQCVILSPTRELTLQIFTEALKFSKDSMIKCEVVYGGTSVHHQTSKIMRGIHIIVATPGRLIDFVNKGKIAFSKTRFVVLDEADRMLDMGFQQDIDKVMNHSTMGQPGLKSTLMFSATFPTEVQSLAARYLHDYLFVAVGIVGGACSDVEQVFRQVARKEKKKVLLELLREHNDAKTMVFMETKKNVDFMAAFLCENNMPATSIHGDRLQRERETALRDFKYGNMKIIVCTAVAARGLDIKGVDLVVNVDLPKSIDEYVHRIGRTGRVGNRGLAISFYDAENDRELAADLVKILAQAEQSVPEYLQQDAGHGSYSSFQQGGFGGSDIRNTAGGGGAGLQSVMDEEEQW